MFFPHFCTSGFQNPEEIKNFFNENIHPGHSGLYLSRRGFLPPGIKHTGPDSCNALIAPVDYIMSLIKSGSYIIQLGWLLSWERYVDKMGFNHNIPTSFYSSNLNEIIVLDTGVIAIPEERIKFFEIFSGLPVRTIPMGLSHLTDIIHT